MKTYEQFRELLKEAYPISKGKFRLPIATTLIEKDSTEGQTFTTEILQLTQNILDKYANHPQQETIQQHEPQILPFLKKDFTGILRYDILVNQNKEYKIIEINSDYPDGLILHDYTYSTLLGEKDHKNTQLYLQLFDKQQTIFILYPSDAEFLDAYYQEYETLKKNGFQCFIGQEKDIECKKEGLFYQNHNIHTIKRCCEVGRISTAFLKKLEQYPNITFINSFDLRGLGYKSFLQHLNHPFIPKTQILDTETAEEVITHKNQRIIKPVNLFEGQEVYLGIEYSEDQRKDIITKNTNQNFVAQEYIQISKIPQQFYENGEIKEKEVYFDICPHIAIKQGKVLGIGQILVRFSESKILNVAKGGGIGYVKG